MNNIDKQLIKIQQQERIGLMTHVVVGYPSLDMTIQLIQILADAGSDFIELQIPFSDPIADGPLIMKACDHALKTGLTVDQCFGVMSRASKSISIPLIFMCYYNTILQYGVDRFCQKAADAGASGLIVPDMPPDEETHEGFIRASRKYGLYQIRVVTPASSAERLKLNSEVAQGFVYCVSHFGTTGSGVTDTSHLKKYLQRVKSQFKLPIAVGFGISSREDVRKVQGDAELVAVGSAILQIVTASKTRKALKTGVTNLVRHLIE